MNNKEHQNILSRLEKHFNETSQEELEKLSEIFYNPFENEVTVNEYFDTFAEHHGFLQDLEKNSIVHNQLVFEDEVQHELIQEKSVPSNKLTVTKVEVKLKKTDTNHSQTMYYSAA